MLAVFRATPGSVISDGGPNPHRYRVRPPSFINLTVLEDLCLGHTVADVMVILGSVQYHFWIGLLAATALILGAAYSLWMVKRVVFGKIGNSHVRELFDLNGREFFMLGVLAILTIYMGLYPAPFTDSLQTSVADLLQHVQASKLPTAVAALSH